MSLIYELKSTDHIRTVFKDFYKKMIEEGLIQNQHQLFTYAFLVGLINNKSYDGSPKSDICLVENIDKNNLKIIKGIALMKLKVEDGDQLLKEIQNYADGGIQILMKEYENDKTIRLDKYID
ncbi:MAG: hypothetical protein ACM3UU_11370 [Ignavibacteriales bacterium]